MPCLKWIAAKQAYLGATTEKTLSPNADELGEVTLQMTMWKYGGRERDYPSNTVVPLHRGGGGVLY